MSWRQIEREALHAFSGEGRFPMPAYSEYMPPPYVGWKPYEGARARDDDGAFDITEYEVAQELAPGLARIAARTLDELRNLARGHAHGLSRTLLEGNPAWTPALEEAT